MSTIGSIDAGPWPGTTILGWYFIKAYDAMARRLDAIEELQALAARPALAALRQRDELLRKMDRLCSARAAARLSPRERRMRNLREAYDRHIGWRLQKGAG